MGNPPQVFDPSGAAGVSEKNVPHPVRGEVGALGRITLLDGAIGLHFEDCEQTEPYSAGVHRGVTEYLTEAMVANHLWILTSDPLDEAACRIKMNDIAIADPLPRPVLKSV